ncbi:hypothetical protein NDU88_005924 [Pleurodeles waltl]|uniref:Uncharacterized protein n=1 Tax=Pleurodeles waltl TaxID=8319 RepID=A0AAV7SNB4_PLEWA|nr:hypothetical protein NDU88_005924 [Pleurodeles waltl]
MGSKSGNSVDDNTSTGDTSLCKRRHEGVKDSVPRAVRWKLVRVGTRNRIKGKRESGARKRQRRLRCLRVFLPVMFGSNFCY